MVSEIPRGSIYSALCPHCNKVMSAASVFMMDMTCPICGKFMSKKDIVYALTPEMSYELACIMQKEREGATTVVQQDQS